MKNPTKLKQRWIRVANISGNEDGLAMDERHSSAGSMRSAITMKTDLDGTGGVGGGQEMGDEQLSPSKLASLFLGDFIDIVRDNPACLQITDKLQATVLHHAAYAGRKDIAEQIINYGGNVTLPDLLGDTPLHWAVRSNTPDIINTLIYAGADMGALNNYKMAPIHLACQLDKPDMVEALCRHKDFDVSIPGEYGQTPLHYCAITDAFEAAKKLIEYKPRLCHRDDNGIFVIHCAATHASRNVLNMLLEKAEETGYPREYVLQQKDKENNAALHSAVNSGSEEAVRVCIEFGSPIDILQEDSSTALHLAASQGSLPIVKLLLSPTGSERTLAMCDVEQMTPLHRAAMFDHVEVVEYLIDKGANMDAIAKNGFTPLLHAVSRGSFRSAVMLNKYGADLTKRDCRNRNVLHLAVLSGKNFKAYGLDMSKNYDELQILLNDADCSGCTPIHYATRDGNIKSVKSLIDLGATVNLKDNQKQSPLHFAAKYGRFNSCKRLLDSSIGPNIINDIDGEGMTALHIAALNGHTKVLQLLILRGALLHRDYQGRTPLHLAAIGGWKDTMRALLTTHSYLLDQGDDNGDTALHLAGKEARSGSFDFLLSQESALLINNDKQGPLSVAMEANNEDVVLVAVSSERWMEVIQGYFAEEGDSMRTLIRKMPEVYRKILDRSVTRSAEPPTSKEFWVRYDFSYLQYQLEERLQLAKAGKPCIPLYALNLVVEHNQLDILAHPVSVEYLNVKWRAYGAFFHIFGMAVHIFFLCCLTTFVAKTDNLTIQPDGNTTRLTKEDRVTPGMELCVYCMAGFAIFHIVKEICQIYNQRLKYFTDAINMLEWGLYICTLLFVLPILRNMRPESWQWQCGACAMFLGWFVMLLYQQRIEGVGLYVVMFQVILKTLLRVIMVFSLLILAFSMSMYMLLRGEANHAFKTPEIAMFRVITMMMAEIDFINSYVSPATDDELDTMPYLIVSYGLLALLIIFLPIILMNLLIGLAVGDIASVQQDAKLKRLSMQVELYTDMEQKVPAKLLDWLDMDYKVIFPNKKHKKTFNRNKLTTFISKLLFAKSDSKIISESVASSIKYIRGLQETRVGEHHDQPGMSTIKKKMKAISDQMDRQHELLRLIVQKMDINTEADDKDEGTYTRPKESCGRLKVDFRQIVTAAAMMQSGARERLSLYKPPPAKAVEPAKPSI